LESHFDSDADIQRYEALLEMADLVVHHHNLPELFAAMAGRLRQPAALPRSEKRLKKSDLGFQIESNRWSGW
jgi:hypothetical protein